MRQKNCKKNGESLGKQSASEARSGISILKELNIAPRCQLTLQLLGIACVFTRFFLKICCMPAGRNQLWEVQNE